MGVGESIEYLADEKASDPKVVGIVANGYPTRSLAELGLENKYQGYYATKMALWCYLLSNWDINNLKVNPNLTGVELQRAQKILAAAKDIYSTVVGKGWLTPLIEAGEGVSLSFYLVKQPREKTVNAIGQTTMINRSRMRDVGDTRQDFEELGDAIGAGLYLKEGMNREGQDFYYMHTLIEVIADDPDTLEQRVTAVETLCVASDMLAKRCEYKHEAAFLSFLPLLISDPDIERKSRRNALTSGVAASFPFASFELSDQKGIFLGLNLYNRSPVFIDLYDDYKYTNGNFAAFGNSGAGKSTLLQSIGKRLREQQRKVIYIVPEKGHEYKLCFLLERGRESGKIDAFAVLPVEPGREQLVSILLAQQSQDVTVLLSLSDLEQHRLLHINQRHYFVIRKEGRLRFFKGGEASQ